MTKLLIAVFLACASSAHAHKECKEWTALPGKFLGGYTSVGSSCYSKKDAQSLCKNTAGCNGINKQFDECAGSQWTLRSGSVGLIAAGYDASILESIKLDRSCQAHQRRRKHHHHHHQATCNGDTKGGATAEGTCVKQADGSVCAKTHDDYPQDDDWCYLSNDMSSTWCWCDAPDDDTQLLPTLLIEKVMSPSPSHDNSKVMSHTEGFVMMLFVSSGLAMGLGYVWSRGRRVVIDPLPLLA